MKLSIRDVLRIKSHFRIDLNVGTYSRIEGRTFDHELVVPIASLIGINPSGYDKIEIEIEIVDPTELKPVPVPMVLYCPAPVYRDNVLGVCGARHIDEGEFATKVHHTHSCQVCGHTWRPAVVPTVGVQHLPGFKSEV